MSVLSLLRPCMRVFDDENSGFLRFFEDSCNLTTTQDRLIHLSNSTGYRIEQNNGQRIFRNVHENVDYSSVSDCELYVCGLPPNVFEDELVILFGRICRIYQIKLMMKYSGDNRGYCFITLYDQECVDAAINWLDKHEIRPGYKIKVTKSLNNRRLYVGNINVHLTKKEISDCLLCEFPTITNIILYPSLDSEARNRGYLFIDFDNHTSAVSARKSLSAIMTDQLKCDSVRVNWALPEFVENTFNEKVLFIRGLAQAMSKIELSHILENICGKTNIKYIVKHKDFAFIYLKSKIIANFVKHALHGKIMNGIELDVSYSRTRGIDPKTLNLPLRRKPYVSRFTLPDNYLDNPYLSWAYSYAFKYLMICEKNKPDQWKIIFEYSDGLYSTYADDFLNDYLNSFIEYKNSTNLNHVVERENSTNYSFVAEWANSLDSKHILQLQRVPPIFPYNSHNISVENMKLFLFENLNVNSEQVKFCENFIETLELLYRRCYSNKF